MARIKFMFAMAVVLLLVLTTCTSKNPIEESKLIIHVIDVGQGESILLQAGESVVLIDAGERNKGQTVVDYLTKQNVKQLDLFISTHPHSDHIGGATEVLKNFEVKQIIDSGKVHTSQTYINYLTYIDEKNIPFDIAANQSIKLNPDVVLNIIGPTKEYADINDNSVIVKVTVGKQAVLLTGDMEEAAERDLMAVNNVASTVLKVGHHGSKTSTSKDFLAAVKPKLALISVGQDNSYGHPSSETLDILQSMGVAVYRTDLHGSIKVLMGSQDYEVVTEKQAGK